MKQSFQNEEVLEFFEKGTLPKSKDQERIAAELMGLQNIATQKEIDVLDLKNWYFETAEQNLNIPGVESAGLRALLSQCILRKKYSNYENTETAITTNVLPASKYIDWEKRIGALRSGYRDLKLGTDITGSGMHDFLNPNE